MQPRCAAQFERDMGCTEAELLHWLPGATRGLPLSVGLRWAQVTLNSGSLRLEWTVLEPRRIALLCIPRLAVSFRFDGVDEAARIDVMRHFDLYTQRGGG